MTRRYAVVAGRIRQEMADLARVVARVEDAMDLARRRPQDQAFFLDSAALNLHDFYAGVERALQRIAAVVDGSVPTGPEWHRELLYQMSSELSEVRPQVLSVEVVEALAEYLRFRHVVRNVYTFSFDPERIHRLVERLRPTYEAARADLLSFADLMDALAQDV